ncbi:MAG TPA: DinB family protein [Dehalococcoidia bacterium]|nr:DinB family protein [Dehalococcoidia bacterium]
MDTIEFIRGQMRGLHTLLDRVTEDLSDEQLHYVARPGVQPIAFCLWHYVRTEDNIIRFVIQHRPTVWMESGWDVRLGLDSRAQGTGMSDEDASAFRLRSLPDFRAYMTQVWAATDDYLAGLDPAAADQRVTIKPVGEMSLMQALGGMCLTHGYRHLGEIEYARGLVGLKGATI